MVFEVAYDTYHKQNIVVSSLLPLIGIKKERGFSSNKNFEGLQKVVFDGNAVVMTFSEAREFSLKFPKDEQFSLSAWQGRDDNGGNYIRFKMNKDCGISFQSESSFHRVLGAINNLDDEALRLPEEVEIDFGYNGVSYGIWHGLPKKLFENLDSFSMTSEIDKENHVDNKISWPHMKKEFASRDIEDRNRLEVEPYRYGSVEGNKERLREALQRTGFVRYIVDNPPKQSKQEKFTFEGEMTLDRLHQFEEMFMGMEETQGEDRYDFGIDLRFKGKVERSLLDGIPLLFSDIKTELHSSRILSSDSKVLFPYFDVRPSERKSMDYKTLITTKDCDLETAARLSRFQSKVKGTTTVSYNRVK